MKTPKFLWNCTFHPKNIACKEILPVYRTMSTNCINHFLN